MNFTLEIRKIKGKRYYLVPLELVSDCLYARITPNSITWVKNKVYGVVRINKGLVPGCAALSAGVLLLYGQYTYSERIFVDAKLEGDKITFEGLSNTCANVKEKVIKRSFYGYMK